MAKQTSLYLTQALKTAAATIVPADTTGWKTVYTAGADDAVVKGLLAVSDDTSAVNLRIGLDIGSTVYQIGTVRLPAAAGSDGAANGIDLLNAVSIPGLPLDRDFKRILPLQGGTILKVAALGTVTSGKTVTVTSLAEEY
jgi:hypothetical protein